MKAILGVVLMLAVATRGAEATTPPAIIGPEQRLSLRANPISHYELQNSPSIVAVGDTLVAVWFREEHASYANYAYSTDGGRNWTEGNGFPRFPTPESAEFIDVMPPALCASNDASFYAAVRMQVGARDSFTVGVYRGTFKGQLTWDGPIRAVPTRVVTYDRYEGASLACDAMGRVYLAVTSQYARGGSRTGDVIFTHSADSGKTWAPRALLGSSASDGASVSVHPDGRVTVVWQEFGAGAHVSRTSTVCPLETPGVHAVSNDCPLQFGPETVVATSHDNFQVHAPGSGPSERFLPTLWPCAHFFTPNFPKLAVAPTGDPAPMYVVWAAGAWGDTLPGTGRTVTEVEPANNSWAGAQPIEIGDDFQGITVSADAGWDPYETYSFYGEQGTSVVIDGTYSGAASPCGHDFALYCGSDTTNLYYLGGVGFAGPPTPPGFPPAVMTLPRTGTYYLRSAASGSIFTLGYRGRLRRLAVDPSSVARDQRDVVVATSEDGGATWGAPVRVNDDAPWRDNSLASVAVDSTGTVHVTWNGRTAGECGQEIDTYWSRSTDGGHTFEPARRVSRASNLRVTWDRLGIAASGTSAHVVWTQLGQPDEDIYYARIDLDTSTSTLLRRLQARREAGCVAVTWEFGAGVAVREACVYRVGDVEQRVDCVTGPNAEAGTICDSSGGGATRYRLGATLDDGRTLWFGPVEVEGAPGELSGAVRLQPNPFHLRLRLALDLVAREPLTVDVLDLSGRRLARLYQGLAGPGAMELEWDGTARGRTVAAGMYFVEVRRASTVQRLRIVKLD